jgi:hypothetical protein
MAIAGLGTVNGYMPQRASFEGRSFVYDGTSRGLEKSAIALGAGEGSLVTTHVLGDRVYRLEFNRFVTHNPQQLQAVRVRVGA